MSKKINSLKIKGINDYLNKNNLNYGNLNELLTNSEESASDILLSDRSNLLATYLLIYGLKEADFFQNELNYGNYKEYINDLSIILNNGLLKNKKNIKGLEEKQIIDNIVSNILNEYFFNTDNNELVFVEMIMENEEENVFVSFNKTKEIIITEMKKFNYIGNILDLFEKIIIDYIKLNQLEFLSPSELVKYEIYYTINDIEIKELLYKI